MNTVGNERILLVTSKSGQKIGKNRFKIVENGLYMGGKSRRWAVGVYKWFKGVGNG